MNFSAISFKSAIFSGSGNLLVVFIFLAVALVYGLSMGRNRLVVVTLGVHFSLLLTGAIPWEQLSFLGIKNVSSGTLPIFIFLALILGFYFLIPHSALRHTLRAGGKRSGSWWQVLILSILQIGLILSVVIAFLPVKVTSELSPLAQMVFIGPVARFLWILLPILAIMFLRGRRKKYDYDD